MCIIVTKIKGAKPLPKEIFENCWDNNPNGAGILYNDGKCSVLLKGLMKKEDFMEKVKEANRKECSFVIHTRIATHGSVKPENTHPFVSKTLGFAHNGTMNIKPTQDMTDSETFFLGTIADKTMSWCKENKFLLDLATDGSRCVVFDMTTGEMLHLCEEDWETDEKYPGAMFSNKTYTYKKSTLFASSKSYKNYGYGSYDRYGYDYDYDMNDWETPYSIPYEKPKQSEEEKEFLANVNFAGIVKTTNGLYCEYKKVTEMLPLKTNLDMHSREGEIAKEELEAWRDLRDDAERYDPEEYEYKAAMQIIASFYGIAIFRGYFDNKERDEALLKFLKGSKPFTENEKAIVEEICYQLGITKKRGEKIAL